MGEGTKGSRQLEHVDQEWKEHQSNGKLSRDNKGEVILFKEKEGHKGACSNNI
jgi:hypothetical protein